MDKLDRLLSNINSISYNLKRIADELETLNQEQQPHTDPRPKAKIRVGSTKLRDFISNLGNDND